MADQAVVVTLDGELHEPRTPLLHADDLAAVRGDGIFETLLVRDGRPCLLEAHLARLTQSARLMDLPEPDLPRWRAAVATAAAAVDRPAAATRACCGWCTAAAARAARPPTGISSRSIAVRRPGGRRSPRRAGGVDAGPRAACRRRRRDMPWLLAGAKTLSYAVNMAALRHAERHGAGDVIFVSSDGYILEGPALDGGDRHRVDGRNSAC